MPRFGTAEMIGDALALVCCVPCPQAAAIVHITTISTFAASAHHVLTGKLAVDVG